MSTMDRAKLEEAIRAMVDWNFGAWNKDRDLVISAARAHLATLPKTKMVEVWRVESAVDGSPHICNAVSREDAEQIAALRHGSASFACIKVTGPHLQEIPA